MTTDDQYGLGTIFSLVVALFALGFWIRRMEKAPRQWPQASGKIITSGTVLKRINMSTAEILPIIEYEFDYQGQRLKSAHWRFGNYSTGNQDSAQEVISRYPIGATVTVFVNPRRPAKSVLETHTSAMSLVPFILGSFLLVMGLLALASILHQH